MDKDSQCARIIKELKKHRKDGVENYKFPRMGILRYSSRIYDLRKDGHNIAVERQIIRGRYTGVYKYFLLDEE